MPNKEELIIQKLVDITSKQQKVIHKIAQASQISNLLVSSRNSVVAAYQLANKEKFFFHFPEMHEKFIRANTNFYEALNVQPATANSIQDAIDSVEYMKESPYFFWCRTR